MSPDVSGFFYVVIYTWTKVLYQQGNTYRKTFEAKEENNEKDLLY